MKNYGFRVIKKGMGFERMFDMKTRTILFNGNSEISEDLKRLLLAQDCMRIEKATEYCKKRAKELECDFIQLTEENFNKTMDGIFIDKLIKWLILTTIILMAICFGLAIFFCR